MVTRIEPEQALEIVGAAGYRATIEGRMGNAVRIQISMAGLNTSFILFNCTDGQGCDSAQMRMTAELGLFGLNHASPADVETAMILTSRWMTARRYSAAYVVYNDQINRHQVVVQNDLFLAAGVSRDTVRAFVQRFDALLVDLRQFMSDPTNRTLQGYAPRPRQAQRPASPAVGADASEAGLAASRQSRPR